MKMKCPFCEVRDGLTGTHRHLLDHHLEQVEMKLSEDNGKMQYLVECPFCELDYMREVNPRGRNPQFLVDYRSEIALVAFDQLLYHVLQDHPDDVDVDHTTIGEG